MSARRAFRVTNVQLWLVVGISMAAPVTWAQVPASNIYNIDLATALRLARADNLEVKLAEERINAAKAEHSGAVAKFLPWIAAGVNYRGHDGLTQAVNGTMLDVNKQSTSVGPTIAAQVDVGDALFTTLAAKQNLAAATAGMTVQEQDSTLAAALGYFTLLHDRALVQANREAIATSQAYEQQLRGGVAAGIIFKGDLLRVETQTQRFQSAIIQAQQQQRLSSARLAELLHLDPDIELLPQDAELLPIELTGIEQAKDVASQPDLIRQALGSRAEVQQSQALVEAARNSVKNAKYGPLIPSIGAQAFFGELSGGPNGNNGDFGQSHDYYIGLNWRFGPGGLFDFSRINAATSKLSSAEISVDKINIGIRRQVVEAQTRLRYSAEQMAASRNSLSNATETLRLTRDRKQLGVGIVLEDIQAQQELVRARTEYLGAITDYNKAQYELSKALGNL